MTRLIFIILLLLFGQAFFIISKEKIDLKDPIDKDKLQQLYLVWFGELYESSIEITGKVTEIDWFGYSNVSIKNS